jgi:hypothetical protein
VTPDSPAPERPRAEPEIIPPDRDRARSAWRASDVGETHRIYVTRVGPLGGVLLMLVVGVLAAVMLFAVLGALLVSIPLVAFIVLLLALGGLLRLRR